MIRSDRNWSVSEWSGGGPRYEPQFIRAGRRRFRWRARSTAGSKSCACRRRACWRRRSGCRATRFPPASTDRRRVPPSADRRCRPAKSAEKETNQRVSRGSPWYRHWLVSNLQVLRKSLRFGLGFYTTIRHTNSGRIPKVFSRTIRGCFSPIHPFLGIFQNLTKPLVPYFSLWQGLITPNIRIALFSRMGVELDGPRDSSWA